MENKSIRLKKVFLLAGAFCAFWIGSGFATGQEVLQFLTTSGAKNGIIGALVYSCLLGFFIYKIYGVGQQKKFSNPYEIFEYYCGKHVGKAYVWFSVILQYSVCIVMMAGGGATLNQYYGISTTIGTYAVSLVALGTVLMGVQKLLDIIGVIGPLKVVFLLAICIAALAVLVKEPGVLAVRSDVLINAGFPTASGNWCWSAVLWSLQGLIYGVAFFALNGAECNSVKEARASGLLGVAAIFVVVVLMIIAEIVFVDIIIGQEIPTLAIANHVSPMLAKVFAPLLVISIYSAVASTLLVVTRNFAQEKTKKFNMVAIVLAVFGMFIGTLLPFGQLVNIIYPLAGYAGIALLFFIIYKEFIDKNAFS